MCVWESECAWARAADCVNFCRLWFACALHTQYKKFFYVHLFSVKMNWRCVYGCTTKLLHGATSSITSRNSILLITKFLLLLLLLSLIALFWLYLATIFITFCVCIVSASFKVVLFSHIKKVNITTLCVVQDITTHISTKYLYLTLLIVFGDFDARDYVSHLCACVYVFVVKSWESAISLCVFSLLFSNLFLRFTL